uniref:Uncharacterized protein n=1 Tax=Glossina austeni TaxID=7395 RepID=A0A1A9UJH7_GLOAU
MSCVEIAPFKNKICVKIRPTLLSVNTKLEIIHKTPNSTHTLSYKCGAGMLYTPQNLDSINSIIQLWKLAPKSFGKVCFLQLTILIDPNITIGFIRGFANQSIGPLQTHLLSKHLFVIYYGSVKAIGLRTGTQKIFMNNQKTP